jgi:hypothetical protein
MTAAAPGGQAWRASKSLVGFAYVSYYDPPFIVVYWGATTGFDNFRVTFFHGWPPTEILGAKTVLGTALFATWNYAPVAGQVYGGYIQPWANGEPCGIVAAYFTYGALMVIPPGAPDLSKITPES